ncbi:MAG: hypothetical protein NTZ46_05110 [Verrucomicrobia bacterium]|nr:hypothetical protein [Verrucomicrobiota bacterium]
MNNRKMGWAASGALIVCLLAAWLAPGQFHSSLCFAFLVWFSVTLGALAQLMVHHLTGGRWGFLVQRILEAALFPFPVLAVLFIVVFAETPALRHGTGYFHPAWVLGRAVLCFAIWFWLAWTLRSNSIAQDQTSDLEPTRKLRAVSGPGLVLYFLSVSFAMFDWVMQLEPNWRSTMFPVIMIATQTLLGLSFATAAAALLLPMRDKRIGELATTSGWHDLGKLLFAFVIFWTYVAFAQFLIIWCGNLPLESAWYLRRGQGGWEWLARFIAAICFVGPAAVLLFQPPKKKSRTLAKIAVWIWLAQAVYLFWVIAPSFFPAFHVSWMDFALPLAAGTIWGAFFWYGWSAADPIPRRDPRLKELGVTAP